MWPIGTRVRSTNDALAKRIVRKPVMGTVARKCSYSNYVVVRVDGNKTARIYHLSFWKKHDDPIDL